MSSLDKSSSDFVSTSEFVQAVAEQIVALTCQVLDVLGKGSSSAMGGFQDLLTATSALAGALLEALHHVTHLLIAVGGLVIIFCELVVNLTYIIGKHLLALMFQSWEVLEIVIKYMSSSIAFILQWLCRNVYKVWIASGIKSSLPSLFNHVVTLSRNFGTSFKDYIMNMLTYSLSCTLHLADAIVTYINGCLGLVFDYGTILSSEVLAVLHHICIFGYDTSCQVFWWTADCLTLDHLVIMLVTFMGVFVSVYFVQQLHGRGFPLFLPSPVQRIQLRGNSAAEFIDSDVENGSESLDTSEESDEGDSAEEELSEEDVWEDEEEDEDIADDEMTVAGSDSENSASENEENDQNAINVHLPAVGRRRTRNTPARELEHKLAPDELRNRLVLERDERMCVVCQDQAKSVLLLPCKHVCLCVDCAHELAQSRPVYRRVCPLCRERMETVMYVYV